MDRLIYTIGYSAFANIDDFLNQLKEYHINVLIDVRSVPVASEFYQMYSNSYLNPYLKQNNIIYRNYSKEFGARQENIEYYENGYLNFNKFIKSNIFYSGIDKIDQGINLGYKFVLMCAEKDPIMCHRTIMVARGFKNHGYKIKHILADGSTKTQEDIEKQLVDLYFPNRQQLSLFEHKTFNEYVEEAYQKQNEKIGFKKELVA